MHKIYEDKGIFNFIYSLPRIIYSTIISINLKEIMQKSEKTERVIKIKSVLFFFMSFVLLGLFWFYIGCFCVVYTNTQVYLIKNTLISFSFSLLIPFITYIFPCIIRIKALKRPGEFLYKFSKLLA